MELKNRCGAKLQKSETPFWTRAERLSDAGFEGATMTDIGLGAAAVNQTIYNYSPTRSSSFKRGCLREIGAHIEPLFGPLDTAEPSDIRSQRLRFGTDYVAVRNTEKALALRQMLAGRWSSHGLGATLFDAGPKQG